jgi:hypothetical protein
VAEAKFRLKKGKGSVSGFTDAGGNSYLPGDVVDLPSSYEGEAWLERAEPAPVVAAVPGKMEPVEPVAVPLGAPAKRTRKKSKS